MDLEVKKLRAELQRLQLQKAKLEAYNKKLVELLSVSINLKDQQVTEAAKLKDIADEVGDVGRDTILISKSDAFAFNAQVQSGLRNVMVRFKNQVKNVKGINTRIASKISGIRRYG